MQSSDVIFAMGSASSVSLQNEEQTVYGLSYFQSRKEKQFVSIVQASFKDDACATLALLERTCKHFREKYDPAVVNQNEVNLSDKSQPVYGHYSPLFDKHTRVRRYTFAFGRVFTVHLCCAFFA